MGQRSIPATRTPLTTENTEIAERFQVGPSEAIHSDPRAPDPLGQLADVDLILLGRVSLLRILLSVISGHPKGRSVVIRSSYLPKSSPRLSAPDRTCGRGGLAVQIPQRFAVWWVALPIADPASAGGAFSPASDRCLEMQGIIGWAWLTFWDMGSGQELLRSMGIAVPCFT